MSEEYGPNFITLTDEDGNDIELEYVDALELDGQTYMAFFPVVEDDADEEAAEEYGLVILKSVMENGEELLSTLDSDEELDKVYDLFMEQILSDEGGKDPAPAERFFVLPMAKRRWRTFCTSSRFDEYRVGKMSRIFRPADDETPPLYFVYSKAARRRQGGKLSDGQRFYLS